MTTSRVIRGTKAKIFLYVCSILVITGLIACYNTTLTQLDEIKKSNDLCHQHQDNLSTQLQVISDYKQKLEKSLKSEKAEFQQSKNNLESKINEEKSRSQKLTNEAVLKYNSLQQHYKLLQTEYDDFKDESSIAQKKQLEEINSLQSKLKEVNEELKKVKASKESIKTDFAKLNLENIRLTKAAQKVNSTEAQQTLNFYSEEYRILHEKYTALQKKYGEAPDDIPANIGDRANKASEKSIPNLIMFKMAENPSSSTKAVSKISPSQSQGHLNGAKPLLGPSVTPETAKKEPNLKPPQGVVEPPENREDQNEQPEIQFKKKTVGKVDDPEKDNVAEEVFDGGPNNIGLGFIDNAVNMDPKKDMNSNNNKKRDDQDQDLHQEDDGDDDIDDYGMHPARGEDDAVRN